jgi:hypothetical protein
MRAAYPTLPWPARSLPLPEDLFSLLDALTPVADPPAPDRSASGSVGDAGGPHGAAGDVAHPGSAMSAAPAHSGADAPRAEGPGGLAPHEGDAAGALGPELAGAAAEGPTPLAPPAPPSPAVRRRIAAPRGNYRLGRCCGQAVSA